MLSCLAAVGWLHPRQVRVVREMVNKGRNSAIEAGLPCSGGAVACSNKDYAHGYHAKLSGRQWKARNELGLH